MIKVKGIFSLQFMKDNNRSIKDTSNVLQTAFKCKLTYKCGQSNCNTLEFRLSSSKEIWHLRMKLSRLKVNPLFIPVMEFPKFKISVIHLIFFLTISGY